MMDIGWTRKSGYEQAKEDTSDRISRLGNRGSKDEHDLGSLQEF
jgi:hypothetical protein